MMRSAMCDGIAQGNFLIPISLCFVFSRGLDGFDVEWNGMYAFGRTFCVVEAGKP